MASKRLIVVDISSFIFRAFYAIRVLNAPDGTPVNAVRGVLSMLLKLLSKYNPTHVILAKDSKDGSFRNELYSEYKANRSAPPEELVPQFALIQTLIEKMELPYFAKINYEADDIIGSICVQWKDEFDEIFIASSDKDLMQFVGGKIKMLDTMKDKLYDPEGVFEKMGVRPDQIVDYLSIVGDASDNIPGMRGIGAKGAAKLLEEYDTLEGCIENKDKLKGKRIIDAFTNHLDNAHLSKSLVQIKTDIEIGPKFEETSFKFYPSPELITFLKDLGFKAVLKQLDNIAKSVYEAEKTDDEGSFGIVDTVTPSRMFETSILKSQNDLDDLLNTIKDKKKFAMNIEFSSEDILARTIASIAISFDESSSTYIPFNRGLEIEESTVFLQKVLEASSELSFYEAKKLYSFCFLNNIEIKSEIFDILQSHFVINPSSKHDLSLLGEKYLSHEMIAPDKKMSYSELTVEESAKISGEKSNCIFLLKEIFLKELKERELEEIYFNLDHKLTPVLAKMENEGVYLNSGHLKELEVLFTKKLEDIEEKIRAVTEDDEINLKSPKQVGKLLFETLDLPVIKKTKTGYSTDSEVLEELNSQGESEIPGLILQYRELDKILSTYVKALPEIVNPKSGRIHTSLQQHIAATGRLSSVNPNLQNIPIRSESGRLIRKGFIATPGRVLMACDYSQVELRILAHFSQDKTMLEAFKNNIDIHTQTASEVLGISVEDVGPSDRSIAKAVNFGLMYGQSSFGLAKALRISRKEAKEYITSYFQNFSSVKNYIDELKEECERVGFSKTLFGRKRYLPDIHSTNRVVKSNAERIAVNSPIQGTAADIIKKAMIEIDKEMTSKNYKSKMILQVHDELIFEVEESEMEEIKTLVVDKMENVTKLTVPLHVDMGIGVNWYNLK